MRLLTLERNDEIDYSNACSHACPTVEEAFMKLVSAIIKSFKLEAVQEALGNLGFSLTATEVKGFGRQKGHTELYRGIEYSVDFVPKTKIDVAVDEAKVEEVIDTINRVARTGKIGDGKVFVYELNDAVRIRTGESGTIAL
jgi:nitrogen regulatory protein P-II 2